jgi:putative transposase
MYEWRKMTPQQRKRVLGMRKFLRIPWHCPPHCDMGEGIYLVSAACYQHTPIVGKTPERMAECEEQLLEICRSHSSEVHGWCILPNHYHMLLHSADINTLLAQLGRYHGRSSFYWNGQDGCRGRHVWHCDMERSMRSERHFWASLNYVHNNPVKHGYVRKWQDWPFSSAGNYLKTVGHEVAEEIWHRYPVFGYGKEWDQ